MGHNRIEYEQRSDEKNEVYYCKDKTLITIERYESTLRKMNLN